MKLIAFALLLAASTCVAAQADQKPVDSIKTMDVQWIVEAYSSTDLKDFDRIVADDALFTGANGRVVDKAKKRAGVKADYTASWQPGDVFKIDENTHTVRIFGDTAISHGFVIENYTWKTTKINGRVHFTNTYLKRGGKWQLVASHFTNIKQN